MMQPMEDILRQTVEESFKLAFHGCGDAKVQ